MKKSDWSGDWVIAETLVENNKAHQALCPGIWLRQQPTSVWQPVLEYSQSSPWSQRYKRNSILVELSSLQRLGRGAQESQISVCD